MRRRPVPRCPAVVAVLLVVASAPATVHAAWVPPVRGGPTALFHLGRNPFVGGQHRGVDLAAVPGEPVRAACGGVVHFAGRVAGLGTVSVDCGRRRVSYAPLHAIAVRAGRRIGAGRRLGVIAAGPPSTHRPDRRGAVVVDGLHFGVRLAARRFGYVDPLPFLAGSRGAPPPLVPTRLRWPHPDSHPRPAAHPVRPAPAVAPWTVWAGLALLMTGLAGAGTLRLSLRQTGGAACRASSTSSSSPTTRSRP